MHVARLIRYRRAIPVTPARPGAPYKTFQRVGAHFGLPIDKHGAATKMPHNSTPAASAGRSPRYGAASKIHLRSSNNTPAASQGRPPRLRRAGLRRFRALVRRRGREAGPGARAGPREQSVGGRLGPGYCGRGLRLGRRARRAAEPRRDKGRSINFGRAARRARGAPHEHARRLFSELRLAPGLGRAGLAGRRRRGGAVRGRKAGTLVAYALWADGARGPATSTRAAVVRRPGRGRLDAVDKPRARTLAFDAGRGELYVGAHGRLLVADPKVIGSGVPVADGRRRAGAALLRRGRVAGPRPRRGARWG